MYLKKLELSGFKSFASKTAFEFEPGMTAIVGPNGCGKSNISDAIRWVLGEQSAKDLRGDKMEDVIFSGAVDTKPVGMAEVSLTLVDSDNRLGLDLHEVVVSRRLFRSGESQYLLNKKPCRLRDIHDLFADTGIGKDAYSHFEQGKIDTILSSKPEDRREIFEEAAGIMKYKRDKKETLRKLEATEENLTRLNDIIREVKRQINSISRQAGKARRYREITQELAEIEVGLLIRNRDKNASEHSEVKEKCDSLRKQIEEANALIDVKENEISAGRQRLSELESEYERLQGRKLEILRNIDRETNNISLFENRIDDAKHLDESGAKQIEELVSSISTIEQELVLRKEEHRKVQEEKTQLDSTLALKEEEINSFSSGFDSDNGTFRQKTARATELLRELLRIESEIESASIKSDELRRNMETLESEKEAISAKKSALDDSENNLDRDKSSIQRDLDALTVKRESFLSEYKEKENTRAENRRQIQELDNKLARITSQYNLFREMQDTYEGYYSGVKAVLRQSRSAEASLEGIHGIVADVITVENNYEAAIEAALGNRVQNIITESGDSAEKAIAYLKNNQSGRATFLALDIIRDTETPVEEIKELSDNTAGVLGSALNFVKCAPVYLPVVRFLLSRTIIVRDLECALSIARRKKHDFSIVTLDGEVISPRGAISGGSTPTAGKGILMREARINELAQERNATAEEIDKLSGLDEILEALMVELEKQQVEITKSTMPLNESIRLKEKDAYRLSAERESLAREETTLNSRIAEYATELEKMLTLKNGLVPRVEELRSERTALENQTEELRKRIAGSEEKRAVLEKERTDLKVRSASIIEREIFLRSNCVRLEEELNSRQSSIEKKRNEITSSKVHVEELTKNIQFMNEIIAGLEEEKKKTEQAIELIDGERQRIVSEITGIENEVRQKRITLKTLQEEESALNIKITELRFAISGIDERLRNEYRTSADDPRAKRLPEDTNWDEIETRIEELRRKRESIGEVNMYAIEEQERLQERYDLLSEQQTDLINAKESLLKVISKINSEARRLFIETFEAVRKEFKDQFTQLFGGGHADLMLLDDKDVLESGIDIIASPPGKKAKNILLLSGGEKALTAVSLLLAIFKIKPGPFCVLDEIDAPLDDSNIGRFTEILQEFLQRSQFIIITHNKRTISMADVLYGITMERSGVSKVVSVRFRRRHDPRQQVMEDITGKTDIEASEENYIPEKMERTEESQERIADAEENTQEGKRRISSIKIKDEVSQEVSGLINEIPEEEDTAEGKNISEEKDSDGFSNS